MGVVKLTNQTYKDVCQSCRDLEEMKEDLERAERSGNPHVAAIRARYEHALQRLQTIKREYFPNRK